MDVIPAVDIMNGRVVRLFRGDPRFVTSYENLGNPVSLAQRWVAEGAQMIHVIDLDATLNLGSNMEIIKEILESIKVSIQVGGGIRNLETALILFKKGAKRIILGSLAFKEPSAVKTLIEKYGDNRVVVALDNINRLILVKGWKKSTKISISKAIENFSKLGVKCFLVTSVSRDGTLSGPDIETLKQFCQQDYKIIAAGGIGDLSDLIKLKELGVDEVVIGKALYDGLFSFSEALRTVK